MADPSDPLPPEPADRPPAAPNRATLWGRVLVDELARQGVRRAVIAPGSRSTPVALALAEHPDIEDLVVIDERSAAFVALGVGRASGRPAVVVSTSGTAPAHFHPAVLEADRASVPLLLLTADRPAHLQDAGDSQAVDQLHLFGRAVRWFHQLPEPGAGEGDERRLRALRSAAALAWARAVGGSPSPGPVHLNLPLDKPLGPRPAGPGMPGALPEGFDPATSEAARGRPGGDPWTRWWPAHGTSHGNSGPEPDPAAVAAVAEALAGARRPLVLVGALAAEPPTLPAGRSLRRALARLQAVRPLPVWAEVTSGLRGGGSGGGGGAEILTTASLALGSRRFREALEGAPGPDLVLRLGEAPLDWPQRRLAAAWAEAGVAQISVTADGRRTDPDHGLGAAVVADPARFVAALAEHLTGLRGDPGTEPSWLHPRWLNLHRRAEAAARRASSDLGELGPFEGLTFRALAHLLARPERAGTGLVLSASMPLRDAEAFLVPGPEAGLPGLSAVYANRGANGIDGVTSTALGVARVRRGTKTVLVTGDVAFAHDLSGALTLGQGQGQGRRGDLEEDLIVVVQDNGGGAIFDLLPDRAALLETRPEDGAATFERLFTTPPGLDLEAFARAAGLAYREVTPGAPDTQTDLQTDALEEALARAIDHPGPVLLRVVYPRDTAREARRQVLERVAEAVDRALEGREEASSEVPGTSPGTSPKVAGTSGTDASGASARAAIDEGPGTSGSSTSRSPSGPRPGLAFLHGFTGTGADWAELLDHLPAGLLEGRPVRAPDLPGHGTRPALPPGSGFEDTVDALAGALAGGGPFHLVGYSLGGRLALGLALSAPETGPEIRRRLLSLTLIGASPGLPDPEERRARREADRQLAERLGRQGLAAFVDTWRALPLFASQGSRGAAFALAAREGRIARGSALGWARSLEAAGQGRQPDLARRLGELPVPTLVVAGELDDRYASLARRMAAALPAGELLLVPGAGHAPHLERPARVAERLADHWRRAEAAAGASAEAPP